MQSLRVYFSEGNLHNLPDNFWVCNVFKNESHFSKVFGWELVIFQHGQIKGAYDVKNIKQMLVFLSYYLSHYFNGSAL